MLCFAAKETVLPAAFVHCPETARKAKKRKKKIPLEEKQLNVKFSIVR